MAAGVNLDALIPREDFEVRTIGDTARNKTSVQITDLESTGFFYGALRKPDFQRETAEWTPSLVVGLIRTFIEDDLIPAVILWPNRELLFVIDGSHRLSALIAWVQNDYGDGHKSQDFFHHMIPDDQIAKAQQTREQVEKEFGSYASHKDAIANPAKYGPDIVTRARKFGVLSLTLQWVQGDATKAEESFNRINQKAVTITPQELELLKSRRKPNTVAARAILRRGTGHQYWSSFDPPKQETLRSQATDLYSLIFEPHLRYPIKSLELPAGGSVGAETALRMIYDFVNVCVGVPSPADDVEGGRTIEYMTRCRRVMQMVLSNEPSSLGLHPAVYFYSWTGKQQPILFLTIVEMIVEMDRTKQLNLFTSLRKHFEEFLMTNRSLINQVIRKYGTKSSGSKHLRNFYDSVLRLIGDSCPVDLIPTHLSLEPDYTYLQPTESPYDGVSPTRYSTQVKAGIVMKGLLLTAPRCAICGGVVPTQSISVDHRVRVQDGGESTPSNAQLTHPYCNTGYKESKNSKNDG